mmetsp:Transcript_62996/g.132952  ORF Transcript_62996/g.132952 Transcript_62996/m.132952 type:complete len:311 (-) Transcript_62996:702-1634(-)
MLRVAIRDVALPSVANHRISASNQIGEGILQLVFDLLQRLKSHITCLVSHLDEVLQSHVADCLCIRPPLLLELCEYPCKVFGGAAVGHHDSILTAILLQELAEPQRVLKTAVAALPEERHHRVASVTNQDDVGLDSPFGRSNSAQKARGIGGNLLHHAFKPTNQRDGFRIVLLAEICALPATFLGVSEGLEGLLSAFLVNEDCASEATVLVGQRHEHVIASRPNVKTIPSIATLASFGGFGSEVIVSRVGKEDLLVAPGNQLFRKGREALPPQGVARSRAGSIAGHHRAVQLEAEALALACAIGVGLCEV